MTSNDVTSSKHSPDREPLNPGHSPEREPLIIVLSGPGGVGKGTVARRLVNEVEGLWLSRSWTTREQRSGEADDAYSFVTRSSFMDHADRGGFLEWAEFLGNCYGTPVPEAPNGADVLLEIDVQGARQIAERDPNAVLWFLDAPDADALESRMTRRGDAPEKIKQRLDEAAAERAIGRELGATVIVNRNLDATVADLISRLGALRAARRVD